MTECRLVGLGNAACLLRADGPHARKAVEFFAGEMPVLPDASHVAGPVPVFDVIEVTSDTLRLSRDGVLLSGGDTPGGITAHLGAEVGIALAGAISDGPVFHAAAVANHGRAVLIPGMSGAGKTTLTAHLVGAGLQYITDELSLIPDASLDVVGLARPLGVKPDSWPALETSLMHASEAEVLTTSNGWLIRSTRLNPMGPGGRLPLCAIVIPKRKDGPGATLTPLSKGAASLALLGNLVNARNLPDHGLPVVTRLARTVPAFEAAYEDAAAVVPLIQDLLRTTGSELPTLLGGVVETPVVPDR